MPSVPLKSRAVWHLILYRTHDIDGHGGPINSTSAFVCGNYRWRLPAQYAGQIGNGARRPKKCVKHAHASFGDEVVTETNGLVHRRIVSSSNREVHHNQRGA